MILPISSGMSAIHVPRRRTGPLGRANSSTAMPVSYTHLLIKKKTGVQPTLINPYYITGVDTDLLESLKAEHDVVITLEDGVLDGGFGEKIARFYGDSDMKVLNFGLKKEFLDRYDVDEVLKDNHLTAEQIAEDVEKVL